MLKNKSFNKLIICSVASIIGVSVSCSRYFLNSLSSNIQNVAGDPNLNNEESGGETNNDSKYILSPITSNTLNSTFGSNYYIFVSEIPQVYMQADQEIFIMYASAFMGDSEGQENHSFCFDFVDPTARTIDVRDLGARAGGAIFAYVSETVQNVTSGGTTTYNSLVSMSEYSFVSSLNADSPLNTSGVTDISQSINFEISKSTDYDDNAVYTFYNSSSQSYLHGGAYGEFKFDDNSESLQYNNGQGIMAIQFNPYVYVYSVSQSLAEELSFSVAAAKMSTLDSITTFKTMYQTLPYYEKLKFASFSLLPDRMITSSATGSSDSYHNFGESVYDGATAFDNDFRGDYYAFDAGHYSLTVDYEHGYIKGFSPFEESVSIVFPSEDDDITYVRYLTGLKSDDPSYWTASYQKQKLYLVDVEGLNLYDETITLYIGDVESYTDYASEQGYQITISDYGYTSDFENLRLEVAEGYDSNGNLTTCIFDGEVDFELIGELGDYEYALVDYELVNYWSSYHMMGNLDKIEWQTSPIFTQYQTEDGKVDIGEDIFLYGYFRKAATATTVASPIIGADQDIYVGDADSGFIKRMDLLNEKLFADYQEEYLDMYDDFSDAEYFEDLSLANVYYDALEEIQEIETKEDAYGLQTPDGLHLAYDVTIYIHTCIHDDFLDLFVPNKTTRTENILMDMYSELLSYKIDFEDTLAENKSAVDTIIFSANQMVSDGVAVDNLCKTFINDFNQILTNNPSFSGDLRTLFNTHFYNIRNCDTLTAAQIAYQAALTAINNLIQG